jgi:hypothetical protein
MPPGRKRRGPAQHGRPPTQDPSPNPKSTMDGSDPVGATVDLSADLHGHAIDYTCDQDRAWFAGHPSAGGYIRPPIPHEWCCPLCLADGRGCRSVAGRVVGVRVQAIGPGLRTRSPIVDGGGGCGHRADATSMPAWLAMRLDSGRRGRAHMPGRRGLSGGHTALHRGQP